jgi:hypothetical protein
VLVFAVGGSLFTISAGLCFGNVDWLPWDIVLNFLFFLLSSFVSYIVTGGRGFFRASFLVFVSLSSCHYLLFGFTFLMYSLYIILLFRTAKLDCYSTMVLLFEHEVKSIE